MSRSTSELALPHTAALAARALLVALVGVAGGCGLTVTNERLDYDHLDVAEKSAIEVILEELGGFNDQIKNRTEYDIDRLIDRDSIHVSFEGYIFNGNLGTGVVHVSTWENLSPAQQALVQQWFGLASVDQAREAYRTFFYRFLAVAQGAKQYMYDVLTPSWVYAHRSLFNLERDTIRTAMSHFAATGRRAEMWGFVDRVCQPVIAQHDATYAANFTKQYLKDNFQSLANPTAPTGYMYFICRWYQMGKEDSENLTIELNWLRDLPNLG